jgi:antitoxin (DNA-binding transcriptional repressor) of toxin-antitoxin stability system
MRLPGRRIQASAFKAKCLGLIDQVARTGENIVITKSGKPVVEPHAHRPLRANGMTRAFSPAAPHSTAQS